MRTAYAIGLAVFLATSPAMAQMIIGGDNDAARHEHHSQQDRAAARQDNAEAHRDAAMGNYNGAALKEAEAHHEWRDANRQEHRADHDSDHGFSVQIGH
jgi:hypothetical protein